MMMTPLDVTVRIAGFLCLINGSYISTEICGIASSKGIYPWRKTADLRVKNFAFPLLFFPSELVRKFIFVPVETLLPEKMQLSAEFLLLRAWALSLAFLGALMLYFGFESANPLLFAATWLVYTTLCEPCGLAFPWHWLMSETLMVLGLNVVQTNVLRTELLLRYLLIRLIFGFAKTKFFASSWSDRYYLLPFLYSMPMPSPLGLTAANWIVKNVPSLAHLANNHLRARSMDAFNESEKKKIVQDTTLLSQVLKKVLVLSYFFYFFAEVVAPLFILFAPQEMTWLRFVGCGSIALLMIGVLISGNFGFFTALTISLCFPAFGSSSSSSWSFADLLPDLSLSSSSSSSSSGSAFPVLEKLLSLYVFLYVVAGTFLFVTVSWIANSWCFTLLPGVLTQAPRFIPQSLKLAFTKLCCILVSWRIVCGYGIFPPHTFASERLYPIFQWSADGGVTWKELHFKYQVQTPNQSLGGIVPLVHPYLSWTLFYPIGLSGDTFLSASSFVANDCFKSSALRQVLRVAFCLLEEGTRVTDLFLQDDHLPSREQMDSPEFMVKVRARFHLPPHGLTENAKQQLRDFKSASFDGDEFLKEDETGTWLLLEGPQYLRATTRSRMNKYWPRFALDSVREARWICPEQTLSWKQFMRIVNPRLKDFIEQKENKKEEKEKRENAKDIMESVLVPMIDDFFPSSSSSSTTSASASSSSTHEEPAERGRKQEHKPFIEFLRCINLHSQLLLDTQRLRRFQQHRYHHQDQQQEDNNNAEWIGHDTVATATDIFKMQLKIHGATSFNSVVNLVQEMTFVLSQYADTHEGLYEEEIDDNREYNSFGAFLKHMAFTALVVQFFIEKYGFQQIGQTNRYHQQQDDQEEKEESKKKKGSVEEEDSILALASSSQTIRSLVVKIVYKMTQHPGMGPASFALSHCREHPEALSTIVSVLVFVCFNAVGLREEASVVRSIDCMALIHVSEDETPPLLDERILPGYLNFFARFLFKGMQYDNQGLETVPFNLREQDEREEVYEPEGLVSVEKKVTLLRSKRPIVEKAPMFVTAVNSSCGLQHVCDKIKVWHAN